MEVWDVFDADRKCLGRHHIRGQKMKQGEYHIVVEIFTFNKDGKLLVTQRDAAKTHPLLWECTGGSVTAGESSLIGAVRELEEETGLVADPKELQLIGTFSKDDYFLDSYRWQSQKQLQPTDFNLQDGEVCDAKFITLAEWEEMNDKQLVVPTVWKRYEHYKNRLAKLAEIRR